jgi:hypothetical protein
MSSRINLVQTPDSRIARQSAFDLAGEFDAMIQQHSGKIGEIQRFENLSLDPTYQDLEAAERSNRGSRQRR